MASLIITVLFLAAAAIVEGGRVTHISPTSGSEAGATRLTIFGEGFAHSQFNYYHAKLGNLVTFVSKSRTRAIPCDVIPYYSTPNKIVCDTRSSPSDTYNIRVQVDGKWLENKQGIVYCTRECIYEYQKDKTPTITSLNPRFAVPGNVLTIRGKMFTDQYVNMEGSDPNKPAILRIFAGESLCDPKDPDSQQLYGIEVDETGTGYVKCKPTSVSIGSHQVSFLVSRYGRSHISQDALLVDSEDQLYSFQSHADVTSVHPSVGSSAGGTILTIRGQFPDDQLEQISVSVGGVPCAIKALSADVVTCLTGQASPNQNSRKVYPGARGILREVWTQIKPTSLAEVAKLTPASPDYHNEVMPDSGSPPQPSFGEINSFSSRLRGFFVPPSDNNYTFYIKADDKADLYFSQTGPASAKQKIAFCPNPTKTWSAFPEQISAVFQLKGGKAYYLEANHVQSLGESHVTVGVKVQQTRYVKSQLSAAVNEKQEISITSTRFAETQIINATKWDDGQRYDVQLIIISNCTRIKENQNEVVCGGKFQLIYANQTTPVFDLENVTSSNIRDALNSLEPIKAQGYVLVTSEVSLNSSVYTVTFHLDNPAGAEMLRHQAEREASVEITRLQKGKNSNVWLKVALSGRTSDDIHVNSTAAEFKEELQKMLGWECSYQTPPDRALYYNGFETKVTWLESGNRVLNPFCDRHSLRNPSVLFRSGQTVDMYGRALKGFDVSRYRQLCFAYKGAFKNSSGFHISFTDKYGKGQEISRSFPFPALADGSWHFDCINMFDHVMQDGFLQSNADRRYEIYIESITVTRVGDKDVFIDDLFIWRDAVRVKRTQPPALPNGNMIESVDVRSLGLATWMVYMTPAACGTGIELLQIAGAAVFRGNSSRDHVVYKCQNCSANSTIHVSRVYAATSPVGGMFEVSFQGQKVKEIPANISAEDFKTLLEDNLAIGTVSVARQGSCAGFQWTVEWSSTGGDQPIISVDGTGLTGLEVSINVSVIEDGGLFMGPIPGDMLRVAEPHPQVTVAVKSVPSSCSARNCSFVFLSSATPSLSSVSPTTGRVGTKISLSGTGFKSKRSDVEVVIGGRSCRVTHSTQKSIFCIVGQLIGGQHEVTVRVNNKGFASSAGRVVFTYTVSVNSTSPQKGSTAGGTKLTIEGDGFGVMAGESKVMLGQSSCDVLNSSITKITCLTSAYAAGSVDIDVIVRGVKATRQNAFQFDSSVTASITSISPSTGHVWGRDELVIKGKGFGRSSQGNVTIGSEPCSVVTWSDVFIKCSTPAQAPGKYAINVYIGDKGRAAYGSKPPQFEYVLKVSGVSPRHGSILGGTMVSIRGEGFSFNASAISVTIGDTSCKVQSSGDTEIVCRTESSTKIHSVDNSGVHAEYGMGYAWSPQTITINMGDSVQWSWASALQTDVTYGVQQTRDSTAAEYDGTGFKSSRSGSGSFTFSFQAPGIYYYSSGAVDPCGDITMKGRVIVKGLRSTSTQVKVKVGQFSALSNVSDHGPHQSVSPGCSPGITTSIPGCSAADPLTSILSSQSFAFWECNTPEVTSIRPNLGVKSTVLTIEGKGFGPAGCHNDVRVGSCDCVILTSSTNKITCQIAVNSSLQAGVPYEVEVRVNNRGLAVKNIANRPNGTFTLIPTVSTISPSSGSLMGGTEITVTGEGFPLSLEDGSISMQNNFCTLLSSSYTQIKCRTLPSKVPKAFTLSLRVGNTESLCLLSDGCNFLFADEQTPRVDSVVPDTIVGFSNLIRFYGSKFPTTISDVNVKVGNFSCAVTSSSQYMVECRAGAVVAGKHATIIHVNSKGYALFGASAPKEIKSVALISNIAPTEGSVMGGTEITINGSGFDLRHTRVRIGKSYCVTIRVTTSQVICQTIAHAAGSFELTVTTDTQKFPSLRYAYRHFSTPVIKAVTPSIGQGDITVTIKGSGFDKDPAKVDVRVANTSCTVETSSETTIQCRLTGHAAGKYNVVVLIHGKGFAAYEDSTPVHFTYQIKMNSVSPRESSFGGGRIIKVTGEGFDSSTVLSICGKTCNLQSWTFKELRCEVPAYTEFVKLDEGDKSCDAIVSGGNGMVASKSNYFFYNVSMTSYIDSVMPRRGGTGGGVLLTIKGSGFSLSRHGNKVSIGGVKCNITFHSTTEIRCRTGARMGSIRTRVRVEVEDSGVATQSNADFEYVDVWSSPFSWGYKSPPAKGDFAVIEKGQTMLLDTDTPVLAVLVIKGQLIFDEKDITLNAEKILVVNGGKLQVGTESEPFQHKAKIVLHGHAMSKRLPIYGAKVLAVREGTLDLHGRHVRVTWTHLAKTAIPGDMDLQLKQQVRWQVGDQIVLASTSQRSCENEELNVTSVSSDGKTIGVTPAVKYTHVSLAQNLGGKTVQTRAEVGLLTRNVVVEGSVNDEWTEDIPKCPKEFQPGQFAVQTCYYGRYGREKGSDQFGSQIMIHAKEMNQGLVTGRISYIEVRNAGQAFNLGRYPIHFHMSGDVTGSYVRGCAIHHTFNRAVTIHGVRGLMVERNVAYHVMGHAYFIEDGIETGNTIQYNLGVFVQTSSSLLTVDATPAAFWITNPNNTVRHNTAAGGSHFGFWYNMPVNPGGPSFTESVCPRKIPLGEFRNNTAHSFGRYGLWIFPTYVPAVGGRCSGKTPAPAQFHSLLAYSNLKGFEVTEGGAIQVFNFTVLDNIEAGLEFTLVDAAWGQNQGPLVKDSLIVGHSAISAGGCTQGGLVAPKASFLTVSGATFVNFDAPSCTAVRCCSFCKNQQGGFTTKFANIQFTGSPNKAVFQWEHECVLEDLDGSLTGIPGGSIVPWNRNLPPKHCSYSPVSGSAGSVKASVCNASVQFRRMAWNKIYPASLQYKDALLSTESGTSAVPWVFKRITHPQGWMVTVILGEKYNLTFQDASHLTNLSYSATFYEFDEQDHIWITHPFSQKPDMFITTRKIVNMSSGIPLAVNASHGDWFFKNFTKEFTYIVTGKRGRGPVNQNIKLQLRRCYFRKCIRPVPPPPPEKRPRLYLTWSDPEAWYGTEPGYGGYNKQLPQNGSDVMIKEGWWMVADTDLPKMRQLIIYGTLELDPHRDFVLSATYIIVGDQGNLIIGWEGQPMIGNVLISLNGDRNTPNIPIQDGSNLGSKALGVFGNLEIHGVNRSVYWTRLSRTSEHGDKLIHLQEPVDWNPGEEVVIATTTYEPYQTEILRIVSVSEDGKTLHLNDTLQFRHISATYRTGNWNYSLAAEVGLLTRNIVFEGANDVDGVLEKQSFGCRVLIGSFGGSHASYRRIRIENAEFRYCGQEGFSDYDDPRYSLALIDVGSIKDSYIRGNALHDGFNTAIGVIGTDDLTILDNVVHHTVGSSVKVSGRGNELDHNLVVLSVSPATYKGRREKNNLLWHAAFDVSNAHDVMLRGNTAAGSERIGFHIRGETCYGAHDIRSPANRWSGNVAHSTLHGVHVGYHDGIPECLKISGFLSWKNWDYGIFGTPTSRVIVQDSVVADCKTGILFNVWKPPAVSHVAADKFVRLENVLVVGTSPSFDCATDLTAPKNAYVTSHVRSPRAAGGGHIGFLLSTFMGGGGLAPEKPWNLVMSPPALRGVTKLNGSGFSNFGLRCKKRSVAITTNPGSGDAFHPVEINGLRLFNVSLTDLLYIKPPNLGLVNPSDCVDMDCDGNKHVLFKDLDGSLTSSAGGSVIAKAEFEWNGDPRRGLGDYRLPKAMLMTVDGQRLNSSLVAPHHGIVRGTRSQNMCIWQVDWNAYKCHSMDYEMLIIESLDADTMVRRLSPVALSAEGFTDLLNGPMDQGWCHGYTCQERLSTFFSVVATGFNYTLYFTGTNPQRLRLRLLNSDPSQVLRLAIWYSTPQRLDVYRKGVYIQPTNAQLKGQSFTYVKNDPKLPDDQFEPPLSSVSGANYFDRRKQMLFVVLRGNSPVDIRTMPIVQIKLGCKPVDVNEFFEKNLVENLAGLLQIDKSRIRIVEIVSALRPSRRRRALSEEKTTTIRIEIGEAPFANVPYTPDENFNPSYKPTSPPSVSPSVTPLPEEDMKVLCEKLQVLATKTVEAAQTGAMASGLKLDVVFINVTDPEPPRIDPTGGNQVTNGTGGPSNGTWRYDQVNAMKEGNKTSLEHDYRVPVRLLLMENPNGANETVAFSVQPSLVMLDADDNIIPLLGHGASEQWYVTATIRNATGDPEAVLGGNSSVPFTKGTANFTNLSISHSGRDYILDFKISYPSRANFTISSQSFDVRERVLYFSLAQEPSDSNETVPFEQQPRVEVRDAADGSLVTNTGWKGRQWICRAKIADPEKNQGQLNGFSSRTFVSGVAAFHNLSIDHEGQNYVLEMEAFTNPASTYNFSSNTSSFRVKQRRLGLFITQQPGDCNDTVPCGFQPVLEIRDTATNRNAGNLGWRGRKWRIHATIQKSGAELMNGSTKSDIPPSGRIIFTNISFNDVAIGYQLKFEVTVLPASSLYSGMAVSSQKFDVLPRKFYLALVIQPGNVNQSVVFGTQPVVEVRDVGTRRRATPLNYKPWISVSLGTNPKPGEAFLNGTCNVSVVKERAEFTDLLITRYGSGFVLLFQSTYGQSVTTAPFEVNYINDYSPKFHLPSGYNASISEGVPIGTFVIFINATDMDEGTQGQVYYSIVSGDVGSDFSIDNVSGVVTTHAKLDREKKAIYALSVRASDGAVPDKVRYTDVTVTVNVGDINDNSPAFVEESFVSQIRETALADDVIVRAQAVDIDTGSNADLRYSITTGNAHGYFGIREDTGDIVVNKSLDLEGPTPPVLHYILGVNVTDLGRPTSRHNTSTVNIVITPVNEFSPQFTHPNSANFSIEENVPVPGGLVLIDVNATDRDFGSQGQVWYSIVSGNQDDKFNITSVDGVITLLAPLDYETSPNHTLVVRASDSGSAEHRRHADFTYIVNVVDVNDNTPQFAQDVFHVNVLETCVQGDIVWKTPASDVDSGNNGKVSLEILSGNEEGFFALNADTGEMTLQKRLDLEKAQLLHWNFTMVVKATDKGKPPLSSNATLQLKVVSVNEFPPKFTASEKTTTIPEDTTVGHLVFNMSATDADFGTDGKVRYSISQGNDGRSFRINPDTGEVFVHTPLDREKVPVYHLKIQASDRALLPANQRSSHIIATVILKDINDNKPEFGNASYYTGVKETASVGEEVLTVQAVDTDQGTNGEVQYLISSGNSHGFFSMDANTGTIKVKQSLDLESQQHVNDLLYILIVQARDKGQPRSLSNDVLVTIEIKSVNEFTPKLEHPGRLHIKIPESTQVGSAIVIVNATDGDFGADGTLTYSIITGNDVGSFSIDHSSGLVSVARVLDYETIVRYVLVVQVTDSGTVISQRRSTVAKVTVRLTNVNDSGGVDIQVEGVAKRLTPPGDPAEHVGLKTSSTISISLLYENGTTEKLPRHDPRVSYDDSSESRGLFTVLKNTGLIQVNQAELLGEGTLIVRVHNVYNVRVPIKVVGYSALEVWASLYPAVQPTNRVLTIKRVGSADGNFQQATLGLNLVLTDNSTFDVSTMQMTSYHLIQNNVKVQASIGPNPFNLLRVSRGSDYGTLSVCGEFARKKSSNLDLLVSKEVVTVQKILSAQLNGLVNKTLVGLKNEAVAQIHVHFLMSDSSSLVVRNFSIYSGLVKFKVDHPEIASVDNNTGRVILLKDYHDVIIVIVTANDNSEETVTVRFFCNTEPPIGGVDIGQRFGPAIPYLTAHQKVEIPLRVNAGAASLLAFDVTISYDANKALFLGVTDGTPYHHEAGIVHLANVIKPDTLHMGRISTLAFKAQQRGVIGLQAKTNMLMNDKLGFIGTIPPPSTPTSCPQRPLGDVNMDCVFDVMDAGYTLLYSLARERKFRGSADQKLFTETTPYMKRTMDFNVNGFVDRNDAFLLSRATFDMVRFTEPLQVILPDHTNQSTECAFKIHTKLTLKNGDPASEESTQVFFEMASNNPLLYEQLKNTELEGGAEMVAWYDGQNELFGGIFEVKLGLDGRVAVASKNSHLQILNLGLSMIQVTQNPPLPASFVSPLFSFSRDPEFNATLDVPLTANSRLLSKEHSPQLHINMTESTSNCLDPWITKNVRLTFENDFSAVKGNEKIFTASLVNDLTRRITHTKIENVRLLPGSILAYFDVLARQSHIENVLGSIWDLVRSGYTLNAAGMNFKARKSMQVDNADYYGLEGTPGPEEKEVTSFPLAAVVSVCVVAAIIAFAVVLYFTCRKRIFRTKRGFRVERFSRVALQTRKSSEQRVGMELTSIGHTNYPAEFQDNEVLVTPRLPRAAGRRSVSPLIDRKMKRVESAASQVSIEAWTEGSLTPDLKEKRIKSGRATPSSSSPLPSPAIGKRLLKSLSGGHVSPLALPAEITFTEGSSLSRSPALQRKVGITPLGSRTNLIGGDSSDEESRDMQTDSALRIASGRSLTPQTSGSRLINEATQLGMFERAVLHKRPQKDGSKLSNYPDSAGSRFAGSGYSTPRLATPLQHPGTAGNNGENSDLAIEDETYTVRLAVNLVNTNDTTPFNKLGFLEFANDATLADVRKKLKAKFIKQFHGKQFFFQDDKLTNIEPIKEEKTVAKSTYNLSIIIKLANQEEAAHFFCPCGNVAYFRCTACYSQGYCDQDCQISDWGDHKTTCQEVSIV